MIYLSLISIVASVCLLATLCYIDLKIRLLPNKYVFPLAGLGIIFHASTGFALLSPALTITGGFVGFISLFSIRFFANMAYKEDALGLGDVKLLGAGGLWLGPSAIMLGMALGAFMALLHGVGYVIYFKIKTGDAPSLKRLKIPAGPGFICGMVLVALFEFHEYGDLLINEITR